MKDTTIIKIISITYSIIVSFLSFIFLSLIVIFIVLQNGLYLDNLSFSNITAKNIYIKWNNKLSLIVNEVNIDIPQSSDLKSNQNYKLDFKELRHYITMSSQFFLLSDSILIEKLHYKDIESTLSYNHNKDGFITASSNSFQLNTNFKIQNNSVVFNINKITSLDSKVNIYGKVILNPYENKIFSKLNISINNDANLTLYATADRTELRYTIKSNKDIKHIHQLISLFHLPKALHYWTIDAIHAKSLTIKMIKGSLQYNHLADAYKKVYMKVTLNKLNYIYNPKLDAIHTQQTDLEFKNGVLNIYPRKAYSYGMYLNRSWLNIDFTKAEELLTLYLRFNDGKLNKNMLKILRTYGIKLPFLQHTGKVKTDLKITVNLINIKVNAHGYFRTKKANFDYLGLNIDIKDTLIKLDNYDVKIPRMKASYKDIAQANVTVNYDAKKSKGAINFNFNKIKLDPKYYLDQNKKTLHAVYQISPKGDNIIVEKSFWNLDDFKIALDPLKLPFSLKTLKLAIPTTYFKLNNMADGFITGDIDIKSFASNIKVDLLNFKYNGIKLAQSNALFQLRYNKKLTINSLNPILLHLNGSPYKLKKFLIESDFKTILLKNTELYISNYIHTQINAKYNIKKQKAKINLNNFIVKNPKTKTLLYYNNKIELLFNTNNKGMHIYSNALAADLYLQKKQWKLSLQDIHKIAQNSKILQTYQVTNGTLEFYKRDKDKYTKFKADINYKYKILTDHKKAIQNYHFTGYITNRQTLYCTINKKLHLKYSDTLKINLADSGINFDELLKFIDTIKKSQTNTTNKSLNILFKAINSYIYVNNNRYIISDKMNLQYYQGVTSAQLYYAKGEAGFRLQDDRFHLYGKNFNDKFMEKLFSLSKFKGGSLDFSLSGKLSDYEGTFFIKDTTIQDYVVLNNILAFINTIPSLATFSLPGYNKSGLYIDKAYMKFHLKKSIFHISDIYIGSKEIKIIGKGDASVKYNNINLTLNLKTDIGSSISKIPVVGYLIFDGKSLSTTLKITGKLTDPKVETMIAKDIAVAPLNIIQRTLTLPYKIIKGIADYNSSKTK